MRQFSVFCFFFSGLALACLVGCQDASKKLEAEKKIKKAESQVAALAEKLDSNTTTTGAYIHLKENEITETDPWGTPLDVSYAKGGLAETVTVRSAGPDKKFHTDDDILSQGVTANFKGVGEGIKKNVEETAANAAKGVVKGTVSGVKEAIKDTFSRKNKPDKSEAAEEAAETK